MLLNPQDLKIQNNKISILKEFLVLLATALWIKGVNDYQIKEKVKAKVKKVNRDLKILMDR